MKVQNDEHTFIEELVDRKLLTKGEYKLLNEVRIEYFMRCIYLEKNNDTGETTYEERRGPGIMIIRKYDPRPPLIVDLNNGLTHDQSYEKSFNEEVDMIVKDSEITIYKNDTIISQGRYKDGKRYGIWKERRNGVLENIQY